ncbi:MAG: hypothetical protein WCA20_15960 [Candidatus Sulfotelmatobacter sp.]
MSELFREAFRRYYAQQARRTLEEIGEYAASRNPGYTEADVTRLIKEAKLAALISLLADWPEPTGDCRFGYDWFSFCRSFQSEPTDSRANKAGSNSRFWIRGPLINWFQVALVWLKAHLFVAAIPFALDLFLRIPSRFSNGTFPVLNCLP